VWLALIALVVLVLPDTAINTASYWTGVAAFLALYRLPSCASTGRWSVAARRRGRDPARGFLVSSACSSRRAGVAAARARAHHEAREAWHQERRGCCRLARWRSPRSRRGGSPRSCPATRFVFPIVDGT